MALQIGESAFLVNAHQPRITPDIGGQDRCQAALDAFLPHSTRSFYGQTHESITIVPEIRADIVCGNGSRAAGHAVSVKISRPISMRRISEVPAPIS
jgi:hypothetical protein